MTQEEYNEFKDFVEFDLNDDIDAYKLLKELKYRVSSRVWRPAPNNPTWVQCRTCYHFLHQTGQNFCSNCGQALDWGE